MAPSSPPTITIEVSEPDHDFIQNGDSIFCYLLRVTLVLQPQRESLFLFVVYPWSCFTKSKRLYSRAPWLCLQQQFLWQRGLHGRGHSPPPRYWECYCNNILLIVRLHQTRFFSNIRVVPGLPRQDSGHWWTSFFFAKPSQPGMQNGSEHQKWAFKYMTKTSKTSKTWRPLIWCIWEEKLTFICVAEMEPTPWPTVRWPASPRKWSWRGKLVRAVTVESLRPVHQLYPRAHPCPEPPPPPPLSPSSCRL